MPDALVRYPEDYKEACFYAWYEAGQPGTGANAGDDIIKVLPVAPDGRKPEVTTVRKWMRTYDWRSRAQALDAQVSLKMDTEVVEKRIKTLKELADAGDKLMNKGLKYLEDTENPFMDNVPSAVRAVVAGAEMKFKYAGQADGLATILQMSDKQLEKEALRLLGKNENEIIDIDTEDSPGEDATDDDNN